MNKINEYIEYLKSFKNDFLNEKISDYINNKINFSELELNALKEKCLSKYNYYKIYKIGNLLKK